MRGSALVCRVVAVPVLYVAERGNSTRVGVLLANRGLGVIQKAVEEHSTYPV